MSGSKNKKEKKTSPYKWSRENSFLCPNIFSDPHPTRFKLKNIEHHKVYHPEKDSTILRSLSRRRLSVAGEIIKFWQFYRNRVHNLFKQRTPRNIRLYIFKYTYQYFN